LTQVFHPWWCETWRVIQQQFRMKECDILGVKHTLTSLTYFQRSRPPTHRIYSLHSFTHSGSQTEINQKETVDWTGRRAPQVWSPL